ncbi:hypothetical protein NMG60_11022298 [Bertholletia excelsa]
MGLLVCCEAISFLMVSLMLWKVVNCCWLWPNKAYRKLRKSGFGGPTPSFPLGNTRDMKRKKNTTGSASENKITHDLHSTVFPFYASWQKSHGKVFVYWLGTEPFLYIADPEFLKQMSAGVLGKTWGKPNVFKYDRLPMFGNGLVMTEGDEWVRHRHVITPAFSPANLKAMASLMVKSAMDMLDRWAASTIGGNPNINVEQELIHTAGEIIAKTSFGIGYDSGRKVLDKLRSLQLTLFNSNRLVGVPFSKIVGPKQTLEARRLGKEIDEAMLSIIEARRRSKGGDQQGDLLGLLLAENDGDGGRRRGRALTTRELVDECKTFFFAGHETTALALTWTMLLLAVHKDWQEKLREEIKDVVGEGEVDPTKLAGLRKMGWVMNEVLRLYSPAPNVQRQAREDIGVGEATVPKGTNVWIDVVAMHHDHSLWGDDVNEFRPERFSDDLYGGCKHKMGFLPFGFGGRMCVGRNLSMIEYKIVLTLILSRFSFSISPEYRHRPSYLLSLRPSHGLPLMLEPLRL